MAGHGQDEQARVTDAADRGGVWRERLTRQEFSRQRGIPVTTLDYWRQRIGSKPRLLKVEVARAEAAAQSFTLRLVNGRAIESSFPLAEQELARLIRIAESA